MFDPKVELVGYFPDTYDNSVATARSCYSDRGIIYAEEVRGDGLSDEKRAKALERRDTLARSIFRAGHHTTLQHAHFQFALSDISRQLIWTFFHSHPFYNSEQVSQRYTKVGAENIAVPPFEKPGQEAFYREACGWLMQKYELLIKLLTPAVRKAYLERFPARADDKGTASAIQKKAQEVARYVLPIGTTAHMYHTVSALTLLRYYQICRGVWDAPTEAAIVVGMMVAAVVKHDPDFGKILDELELPDALEKPVHYGTTPVESAEYRKNFDQDMGPWKFSRLRASFDHPDTILANAVAQVQGKRKYYAEELIKAAMTRSNGTLNLDLNDPIGRALQTVSFTFMHRISHTADSQDQRHRATPAARVSLVESFPFNPDFITPALIDGACVEAQDTYRDTMWRLWNEIDKFLDMGVPREFAAYLLPNATVVRYMESGNLAGFRHKMRMRLCLNAQEEIHRMAIEEAEQIAKVAPLIGEYLVPPCTARYRDNLSPPCPEGDRYCGIKVWEKKKLEDLAGLRGLI